MTPMNQTTPTITPATPLTVMLQMPSALSDLLQSNLYLISSMNELISLIKEPKQVQTVDRSLVADRTTVDTIERSTEMETIKMRKPDVIRHYNIMTSPKANDPRDLIFEGGLSWLIIDNRDNTNSVEISFNDGRNYKSIDPATPLFFTSWMLPDDLKMIKYKSSAVNIEFQCLAGESLA